MTAFRMPSLGADMEAGTLVEWLVKPGDRVKHGDIVAVVETQKGAIEIEIFQSGLIERVLVATGTRVPVGTAMASILTDEEARSGAAAAALPEAIAPPLAKAPAPVPRRPVVPPSPIVAVPGAETRLHASPAARRLAQERGIDLSTIAGTGPSGAIVRADVARGAIAAVRPPEQKPAVGINLDAMREAIAAAMARSKREIPHYYLQHDIDVTGGTDWLARTNAERPPDRRLLFAALTTKAVALAVRKYPAFNGFCRDGKSERSAAIHVGLAIAIRGGGLAAPAIHDVDKLSLDELMERMRDLVQRMRAGRIRSSEIADSTITVSSLGDRGVEVLYGVIYPPQVAIVGFGKATSRPWVIDDKVVPRTIMTATLSGDHRASDGHAGALFLLEIGRLLQEPEKL